MKCEFQELYLVPSRNGLSKPSKIRGSGFKMINMGELFANDYIYDIPMEKVPLSESEKNTAKVEIGDLLFARQSLVESGAGKCSIVVETSDLTVFESHIIRVRLDAKRANPYYYYYYFRSPFSPIKQIVQTGVQSGIKASDLAKLVVECPRIEVQNRIVSILQSIDRKIRTNQQINDKLLQQATLAFENALHNTNSVKYAELGSIADVKGGKRLPKGVNLISKPNNHPYIRVRDLNNVIFASLSPEYEYVDDETQRTIARYIVSPKDLLISIVGTIGLTAIVDESLSNANLTENCVKISNLKSVSPEFLLLYLRSSAGMQVIAKGTVGAVQAKLPIKNIQAIPVPLLAPSEMERLNNLLAALFNQISLNIIESRKLAETRNILLPKLLSGEIDVSDIQI